MNDGYNYEDIASLLARPDEVVSQWVASYALSSIRLSPIRDNDLLAASLLPIAQSLESVVSPDRDGRRPTNLHFLPGAQELREVEKAVSFAAANLAVDGFTGFDTGALFFSLRDVLVCTVQGLARQEIQHYMEWLVVLAADSLATAREQAAAERWHNQLDEGTPVILITPELPAALFVCQPDRRVVASVFGRLLLTAVRTGAKAVIIDVSGVAGPAQACFLTGLDAFLGHNRVAPLQVIGCGVHTKDVSNWKDIAARHGNDLHFENYFDSCVAMGLGAAGWRLVH